MARDGTYKGHGQSIVTTPVDPDLHRKLRIHCASEGRSMKWVVTKAIERYLAWHDELQRIGAVEDARP